MNKTQKHTIVAKVNNRPGVVSRISGLFTRRGYNIENLITGTTESDKIYHMTITMYGTKEEVDLLIRQLKRISDVIGIYAGSTGGDPNLITSELMFIKIKCINDTRIEILKAADILDCRIAGMSEETIIIEVTGSDTRIESAILAFSTLGSTQILRSGTMGIEIS